MTNLPTIQEEVPTAPRETRYFLSTPCFKGGPAAHRRSLVPELLFTSSSCSTADPDMEDDDDTDDPCDYLNPPNGIFEMLPTPIACLMTAPQCPVSSLVLLVSPASNGLDLTRRHSSVGETGTIAVNRQNNSNNKHCKYKNYASINAGCTAVDKSDTEDGTDDLSGKEDSNRKMLTVEEEEKVSSSTLDDLADKLTDTKIGGNGNGTCSSASGNSAAKLIGAAWKNGAMPKINLSSRMNLGRFRRLRSANRRERKATKTLAIVLGKKFFELS